MPFREWISFQIFIKFNKHILFIFILQLFIKHYIVVIITIIPKFIKHLLIVRQYIKSFLNIGLWYLSISLWSK